MINKGRVCQRERERERERNSEKQGVCVCVCVCVSVCVCVCVRVLVLMSLRTRHLRCNEQNGFADCLSGPISNQVISKGLPLVLLLFALVVLHPFLKAGHVKGLF